MVSCRQVHGNSQLCFAAEETGLHHSHEKTREAVSLPDADRLILALQSIAVIGLLAVPLNYIVLKRLLVIVDTVRSGDPFVAANAGRLQAIAWALVGLQILSMIIGGIARSVSTPAHPLHMNAGFSINGWLTVLMTFLLARVFAEGAHMRDDLEGTV